MKYQRGFGLLGNLIAAAAVLGLLLAVFQWLDNNWITDAGIAKGEANIQTKWDKANKDAQDKADAERRKNEAIVAAEAQKRQAAEKLAADYETRWRKAREDANRSGKPLVVCQEPKDGQPSAPDIRLTWRYIGLWESAWTGRDGQPVFGDPAARTPAGADPDGRSPYDPIQALDNHAENARRCSAARRDLNALMDAIERLQGKK